MHDYYKILGINPESGNGEIRKAFHERAKLFHPDVNSALNAKQQFQLLNEAYQTLINPGKRKVYDFKLKYGSAIIYTNKPAHRDKAYNPSAYSQSASSKANSYTPEEKPFFEKKKIDTVLFYFMLVTGIVAVIFATIRLVTEKWEGINNLSGISFGVSFLFLLIYGWRILNSKK
jgi:curved DNA-binding protein CbpA